MNDKLSTVLIVDDMATNIQTLSSILIERYNIKVATNGAKAIEVANMDDKPDIILLDIIMPQMDGYEVCEKLKQNPQTAKIPIIFVTAKDDSEDEEKGFSYGAVDYITKPFKPSTILARVQTHIRLKKGEELLKELNSKLKELVKIKTAKHVGAEERYKELFESSPIPIFIYPILNGAPGGLEQVNNAACLLTGYSQEELLSVTPLTLHPKNQIDVAESLASKIQNGESAYFETECLQKDGLRAPIMTYAVPFVSEGRLMVYSYWMDLSYIKKVENEKRLKEELLIRQSKLASLGEMIGAIGHQWRQPLNSLAIAIQDLALVYKLEELSDDYVSKFKTTSMETLKMMSKTIDDFKNFFSPHKKEQNFIIEDAICEIIKILSAQLSVNSIKVIFEFDENNKHSYFGHKNELNQVILNILANAKDALIEKRPENSFIKIDVSYTVEYEITIEDSAGGIAPEIMDEIFEPYFTTKAADKGTGIGLYISKTIVEEHLNGKITLQNTENGAKFSILLPATQSALAV